MHDSVNIGYMPLNMDCLEILFVAQSVAHQSAASRHGGLFWDEKFTFALSFFHDFF